MTLLIFWFHQNIRYRVLSSPSYRCTKTKAINGESINLENSTPLRFTCSKSTIETLEKGEKYVHS